MLTREQKSEVINTMWDCNNMLEDYLDSKLTGYQRVMLMDLKDKVNSGIKILEAK